MACTNRKKLFPNPEGAFLLYKNLINSAYNPGKSFLFRLLFCKAAAEVEKYFFKSSMYA